MPRLLRSGAPKARSIAARCSAPSSSSPSSSIIRASLLMQRIEPEAGPSTSTVTSIPKLASLLQRGGSSTPTLLRSRLSSSSTSTSSTTSLLSSRFPSLSLLSSSSSFQPSSASTSIQHTQIRTVTYGSEYQPSQRVRKRRHGFLARRRSKGGKKVLIRRRMKGRRFLSH